MWKVEGMPEFVFVFALLCWGLNRGPDTLSWVPGFYFLILRQSPPELLRLRIEPILLAPWPGFLSLLNNGK